MLRRPAAQGHAPLGVGRARRAGGIRLYDYLSRDPDPGADAVCSPTSTPNSERIVRGTMLEPALAATPPGETVQFERLG